MKKLFLSLAVMTLSLSAGCARTTERQAPTDVPVSQQQEAEAEGTPILKQIASSVAPNQVFSTIAAQYKGSVTFIDLWATWCPPCRQAMKLVDQIKPELAAKGCKFVYITGETSPREDFDTMYKTIEGDHFYLTDAQYKGLLNQFNVTGIPHYILLSKEGKVLWQSEMGYPGNDEAKNQIEMALAQ